ncbi:glycosyltransferase [Candidatus Woesearchaeota archaeon]|nr:glycosyltransferase [Candidatus Woesearchaeota archaeon]
MISIIIPTYNRASELKKTLPIYLKQKDVRQLIVIDDNSTDDTKNIVESMIKKNDKIECIYHKNEVNKGIHYNFNLGVSMARGKYIFFGEDDVVLSDDHISLLMQHMKSSKADIIGGRRIWMGARKCKVNPPKYLFEPISEIESRRMIEDIECISLQACFLAKKSIFEKCKFDENFIGSGYRFETDFFIQCIRAGFKVVFCPHTRCNHLPRSKGGSYKSTRIWYELWAIRNNNYLLDKHYIFLKDRFGLKKTKFRLKVDFAIHRLILNPFYRLFLCE